MHGVRTEGVCVFCSASTVSSVRSCPHRTDLRDEVTAPRGEGPLKSVLYSRRGIELVETEPLYGVSSFSEPASASDVLRQDSEC